MERKAACNPSPPTELFSLPHQVPSHTIVVRGVTQHRQKCFVILPHGPSIIIFLSFLSFLCSVVHQVQTPNNMPQVISTYF